MIVPVILCGGSGTRLWPLSRKLYPKQFLSLTQDQTLLQNTVDRIAGIDNVSAPIFVCNEAHRFIVAEQAREKGLKPGAIILEPMGRNTAPAVAVSAMEALAHDPETVLLVLPADHVIREVVAFHGAIAGGLPYTAEGKLVTFGIVPHAPETGYGYIKKGSSLRGGEADRSGEGAFAVNQFVEKPDLDTARQYLTSGEYLWNSGMFLFRADRYLEELELFHPDMLAWCRKAYEKAHKDLEFTRIPPEIFSACPSDSIDYAVMEKTQDAAVVPLDAGWNDIGSWSALWEIAEQDDAGNVIKGDVLVQDVSNSYIHSQDRLIAAVGVDDHVIIGTKDAMLVAGKDKVQDVKYIVAMLEKNQREEAQTHLKIYRPWGTYEKIDEGARFKVNRLTVKPGASVTRQKHFNRAEHWIVVRGSAKITRNGEELILGEDQSSYIPIGTLHQLENPGKIPLEIIEVQTGGYLGEDDIERVGQ